ncbi:unnamed protein product [Brachionus calyciflorus]|uniref:Uncharacterized protein n=1 Tax=Brachionus calyciflorus TaxID=104777 RepID=A0A813SSU1_9BILA|nr:unnamed protein product [Brachionus calyciflorus]
MVLEAGMITKIKKVTKRAKIKSIKQALTRQQSTERTQEQNSNGRTMFQKTEAVAPVIVLDYATEINMSVSN